MEKNMDVSTAQLAATEAWNKYEASVEAYRAAVDPTNQEFDEVEQLSKDLGFEPRVVLSYAPRVLDEIIERRKLSAKTASV